MNISTNSVAISRKKLSVRLLVAFHKAVSRFKQNWFEITWLCALALVIIWRGRSFVFAGDGTTSATVLTSAVIVYGLSFILAEFFLRRQGVGFERYFIAVACVVAGIWLVQGLYHFGFAQARMPSEIANVILTFNFNFNTSAATYPLYWNLLMVSLPFAGYKYMNLNKFLVLTTVIGGAIYLLWINVGYPQFFAPQWFPDSAIGLPLVPHSTSGIELSGYIFNSTFTVVALLPALLFYKKPEANPPTT
jgi:hypothetical protein